MKTAGQEVVVSLACCALASTLPGRAWTSSPALRRPCGKSSLSRPLPPGGGARGPAATTPHHHYRATTSSSTGLLLLLLARRRTLAEDDEVIMPSSKDPPTGIDAFIAPGGGGASSLASASSSSASSSSAMTVVDLQMHTVRESPSDSLASLSRACKTLGVEAFDVYGDFDSDEEQSYLRRFEAEVARHFGKEDGVFCLSGGMAQSIALLIHAGKKKKKRGCGSASIIGDNDDDPDDPDAGVKKKKKKTLPASSSFACHPTSHLLLHENDAFGELLGMEAVVINPGWCAGSSIDDKCCYEYDPEALKANGCLGMEPMRSSHVRDLFSSLEEEGEDRDGRSSSSTSTAATASTHPSLTPIDRITEDVSTLILELPHREIGGKLTPWEEVLEISRMCEERNVAFHCDGARIFEASAGYGHESVKRTAEPFDSVYVSFYKGLGAISGAMLLGDAGFCNEARTWLRRMGGNVYTVLPYAISSWRGFRDCCCYSCSSLEEEEEEDGGDQTVSSDDGDDDDDDDDEDDSGIDDRGGGSRKRSRRRPTATTTKYDNSVFASRRTKLVRVVSLLSADDDVASIVHFDPAMPETNMVHGYLRMSCEECTAASEHVERTVGIRVLGRVRERRRRRRQRHDAQVVEEEFGCRFELTMGSSNSSIDDAIFLSGWKEFSRAVLGARSA